MSYVTYCCINVPYALSYVAEASKYVACFEIGGF